MKRYLLTIFSEKIKDEKFLNEFAGNISMIVDSPQLKFQMTDGSAILYFESEVSPYEVYDFINGVLLEVTNTYILTEITDNNSVFMPKEMKAHLLDMNLEGVEPKQDIGVDYSEMAEDFIENLLYEFDKEVKVPSLNEILDKILDKGINSLTQIEKQILENYSKN